MTPLMAGFHRIALGPMEFPPLGGTRTSMHRLDCLLEILGPEWVAALGSDMTQTAFRFLSRWATPIRSSELARLGSAAGIQQQSRRSWGPQRAGEVVAAEATLALWGPDGLDYEELAADSRRSI